MSRKQANLIAENIFREENSSPGKRVISTLQNGSSTQLHGRRLVAARWACAVLAGLALIFFTAALPARLAELEQLSQKTAQTIRHLAPPGQDQFLDPALGLEHYPLLALAFEAGLMVTFWLCAALLWWRKSDDWLALFLIVALLSYGVYVIPTLDALMAAQPSWRLPGNLMQALGLSCAILYFYIFPNGRFVPRWTGALFLLWLGWTLVWLLRPGVPVNLADPFTLPLFWFVLLMLWWLTGVYAQLYRYRRVSNPVQRQQTKFILLGVSFAVLGYGLYSPIRFALPLMAPPGPALWLYQLVGVHLFLACVFFVPLSITFAILRYRLWDIDIIINRTLVYGALTVVLAGVYAGSVIALQSIFRALTDQSSPLAVAASTLALAALFNPLRRRVQAGIDRRLYRRKYDAAQALAAFGLTLQDEIDLPRLIERLEGLIRETIRPAHIVTWLRTPSGFGVHQLDATELARQRAHLSLLVEIEIPARDPLVEEIRTAAGVVELDRLELTSPACQRLRNGEVKLIVPLISQGELIGWLSLGARLSEQGYSADDRLLLAQLAGQVAPAVRVAQLVRQQQAEARAHERLAQELQVARLIQQTLLPPAVPTVPGWQIAVYWQPARAVGGDFYDFLPLADGRWVLIIGDVADKGVPAALVMATTRAILRGAARRSLSPGAALARTNELLYPETPPQMFVTCLYAILEPDRGRLQYANAGHNLPYRHGNGQVAELRATGMPLGLLPGMAYDEFETTIEPGESLLFYSDGLVEAHDPRREMFGFPRLQTWLGNRAAKGAGLIDDLLAELTGFTGPDWGQEDDVTLLTLERASPPAEAAWQPVAEFIFPSEAGQERLIAEQVAATVAEFQLTPGRLERLKTAVAEAISNAIEHGNRHRPELGVAVQILVSKTALLVRITDQGDSQAIFPHEAPDLEAKLAGLQTPRGWGLFLIEKMVDEVRCRSDESHHSIELILYLSES